MIRHETSAEGPMNSDGVQIWVCNSCSRRIAIQCIPVAILVLDPGEPSVIHHGSNSTELRASGAEAVIQPSQSDMAWLESIGIKDN